MVEDGRPFCPQCRTPQVRVLITPGESTTSLSEGVNSPDIFIAQGPVRGVGLDRRIAVRAAIQAGLLGLIISIIPFVGIVLTGALAVVLYRRAGGPMLTAGPASRLGAAAGTVSFAISSFLMVVRIVFFHAQQEYQDVMIKVAQTFGLDPKGPDVQEMIRMLTTPTGLALTMFFSLVVGIALAAIGGALAASLSPRRR
jgi:hypothetical protein